VATHAVTLPKSAQLKPAATDAVLGDGVLKVDWMRVAPYAASGIYTSSVYDAGSSVLWQTLSFLADTPTGTSVAVRVRTAESVDKLTGAPVWSAWKAVASGGLIGESGQYAQYELTLQSSSTSATPTVKEVALAFLK
jgi:hypothetical protein